MYNRVLKELKDRGHNGSIEIIMNNIDLLHKYMEKRERKSQRKGTGHM